MLDSSPETIIFKNITAVMFLVLVNLYGVIEVDKHSIKKM